MIPLLEFALNWVLPVIAGLGLATLYTYFAYTAGRTGIHEDVMSLFRKGKN